MAFRIYGIMELADRLGLDYNSQGNMDCPFCAEPDPHRRNLHLDAKSNYWRCNKCAVGGGVLHFFSQYVFGEPLPSSQEGRSEVSKKLREFMGDDTATAKPRDVIIAPKVPSIPVAKDDRLHAVYSAMAQIPALQLTKEHRKALQARGLTDEVIERNQYRSIPEDYSIPDFYSKMYEKAGGNTLRDTLFEWYSPKNVKFGLMIAHTLTSAGHDLTGIPGFYKFGDLWCMWNLPGILIPTRNLKGQIVIWQVRKKKGEPKYATLACGSLPGAVNDKVSRCHAPLNNAKLGTQCQLCFTEGPLKADVASELMGVPSIFLAIPGINTRDDLLVVLKQLHRDYHYTHVFNYLDMDRLTNPNVRNGSRKLEEAINNTISAGKFNVRPKFWGEKYARQKLLAMKAIARLRQVPYTVTPQMSVFAALEAVTEALNNVGINPSKESRKNGNSHYWEPETKGIDDYYFSLLELSQKT